MPKVLVVADTPWVLNDVISAITDPDTVVREIADPRTAVEVCGAFRPDAVVIDLQVGSMGGMAICRAVRQGAGEDYEEPATVLLLDRSADVFIARRAGAAAWLVKPFAPQDLQGVLEGLLSGDRVEGAQT